MGVRHSRSAGPAKGCMILTSVWVELRTPRMRRSASRRARRGASVSIGDEGRLAPREMRLAACARAATAQSRALGKHLGSGHPARIVRHAVHQHRHALARQQQGQQRRQVRHACARRCSSGSRPARTRPAGACKRLERGFGRVQEAGDLVDRLALDAHRQQIAPSSRSDTRPSSMARIQIAGIVARQAARASLPRPISLMKRAAGKE